MTCIIFADITNNINYIFSSMECCPLPLNRYPTTVVDFSSSYYDMDVRFSLCLIAQVPYSFHEFMYGRCVATRYINGHGFNLMLQIFLLFETGTSPGCTSTEYSLVTTTNCPFR